MQQLGLKSPVRLKKYRSYRGNMGLAAENILQRQFKAEAPCEKWVTDITEFRAGGQKLYLSPILDLFNGEIVAWETACRPTEELVKRMLNKGLESLAEGEKPLLHSDPRMALPDKKLSVRPGGQRVSAEHVAQGQLP